jgi:hypothetical protein
VFRDGNIVHTVRTPEWRRRRHRWENNIKMAIKAITCSDEDLNNLTLNKGSATSS